jgi:hypothetical protein
MNFPKNLYLALILLTTDALTLLPSGAGNSPDGENIYILASSEQEKQYARNYFHTRKINAFVKVL